MKGKERCKILKEIRQQIADENDIAYVTSECRHKGDCLGTCPKCEDELRYLERELEKRQKLGKAVAVAGLTVAITMASTGCGGSSDVITDGLLVPPGEMPSEVRGSDLYGKNEEQILALLAGSHRNSILIKLETELLYEGDYYDVFEVPGGKMVRIDYDEDLYPCAVRFTDDPEGIDETDADWFDPEPPAIP